MNNHMWEKNSGKEISSKDLISQIDSYDDITGVTYIGGEPLDQEEDLLSFSNEIINRGKDIVLFTGYDLDELNSFQKSISDLAIVIISGRYDSKLRNTYLTHRGSTNQKIIIKNESLIQDYSIDYRQVEIIITPDSNTYLGFPEDFIRSTEKHNLKS